jgi:hypothetical protein
MTSASAIPDSNPTRAELRLVVLGQWVRAGLDLVRGASAGRGLIGGAVALWQVFQAIRLAIVLAQRLSDLQELLSRAVPGPQAAETPVQGSAAWSNDPPAAAAFLRPALIEIGATIRDALGLASDRRRAKGAGRAAGAVAEPNAPHPLGRPTPPRGRPPRPQRSRARRRRPRALGAPNTFQPPIAAPAIGRFRLGAGGLRSVRRLLGPRATWLALPW